jgi:segregation and condensation protein B
MASDTDDDLPPPDEGPAEPSSLDGELDAGDAGDAGELGELPIAPDASELDEEGGLSMPPDLVEEIDEARIEAHLDAHAEQDLADYETRLAFEEALADAEGAVNDVERQTADASDAEHAAETGGAGAPDAFLDADPAALDAALGATLGDAATAEGEPEGPKVDVVRRHLRGLLEALLFVAERPLKAADLAEVARAEVKEVRAILEELAEQYRADARGFLLDELAAGWQLRTSPTFAPFVREMTAQKPVKLTRAQIETLAIVAYRQPITRPEVEDIRGVDAGAVMKVLLDRDLVRVLGKKDEPGRPLLFGTTTHFLSFFGLKSLRDLPTLREFTELTEESREVVERELGEVLPEGPKEPAQVGDANVAAADFDPFASESPPQEPSAAEPAPSPETPEQEPADTPSSDQGDTSDAEREAETNRERERAGTPFFEDEPEAEGEGEPQVAGETEAEDDVEPEPEAEGEPEPAPEAPAGGSKYDPSDEELFPDDDDEDFDEDDEDEDEDEDGEDEDDEGE